MPKLYFFYVKSFVLLAAFGLTAFAATAQRVNQDYLVTAGGDTLRGRLQIPHKLKTVRLFQGGKSISEFTPVEAVSYGDASGPIGVSKRIGPHGPAQFVAPLVLGYVSLYAGDDTKGDHRYYLQAADSAYVIEVPPATATLVLNRHLGGCATLQLGTEESNRRYRYKYVGMSRLIMDYNACRQPQQASHLMKPSKGWHASYGIKLGINASRFAFSHDPYMGNHSKLIGYQAGASLHLTNKTAFSVQLEATYLSLRSLYEPTPVSNPTVTTSIDYSQLQLPLLLRYTIGHGTVRPYLNTGLSAGVNFKNYSTDLYQYSTQADISIKKPISALGNFSLGAAAGMGIMISRPSMPTLSLEARYDRMLDGFSYVYFTPNHESLRLELGISF
ncbi:porin family protein [Hymenobacter sp. BT491]|uniref:porin family protein n=1 Tax=Hymenobacter sp. BT491 TaxID=2766779 RepID=UPI001653911C|nr:porin family protein [Hymenobacter sp. BT491]MBC6989343.1 PorT family protein [Hymenobacter sp. BT491]